MSKMQPSPDSTRLFRLDGRVAFISGGAGHLGRAMTLALLDAGATVYVNGRSRDKLQQLCDELGEYRNHLKIAAFDVTSENEVRQFFDQVFVDEGRLDVLINNAYHGAASTLDDATMQQYANAYEITVSAAASCMKAAQPALEAAALKTGHASVINISSMYGSVSPDPSVYDGTGLNNPPFYGPAKAGLIQFSRYAACHLAEKGIRVNTISPGAFPRHKINDIAPEFVGRLCDRIPLGRIGEPEDLQGAVLFLACDGSSYITGTNIAVDGGWTSW